MTPFLAARSRLTRLFPSEGIKILFKFRGPLSRGLYIPPGKKLEEVARPNLCGGVLLAISPNFVLDRAYIRPADGPSDGLKKGLPKGGREWKKNQGDDRTLHDSCLAPLGLS